MFGCCELFPLCSSIFFLSPSTKNVGKKAYIAKSWIPQHQSPDVRPKTNKQNAFRVNICALNLWLLTKLLITSNVLLGNR